MPVQAFLLVVVAAFSHATWNFLAKRGAASKHLIWFSSVTEAALLFPAAVWILSNTWSSLSLKPALFLLATGVTHVFYTESLLRGYRAGDFTVVYPMARGSGPLLSFCGAVILLHERASILAVAGALCVSVGILLLAGGLSVFRRKAGHAGVFWGLATGCTIACYTLIDAYSVTRLLVSPLLVEYAGNFFRAIVLSGGAYRDRAALPKEYRTCWKEASGIAILTPAGYILVLYAMRLAPISHVAPVREMSMMIGLFYGAKFLREGSLVMRAVGSALVTAGVAALALG